MQAMRRRRLLSALLTVAVALAGLPDVSWAQARPDLELTYDGFYSPDNRRLVKLAIKNVGTAPSSANTKVRVVTSRPEPTPWFRELDLPSLKPQESAVVLYPLAADCSGHVVSALVNDAGDTNANNNMLDDFELCPPPIVVVEPPSPPAQPVTQPLAPVAFRTLRDLRIDGDCRVFTDIIADQARTPPFPLIAGFQNGNIESISGDCQINAIWQSAFRFDLSGIRQQWAAGRLSVLDTELTFRETPYVTVVGRNGPEFVPFLWRLPGNGDYAPTQTCWPKLARPTVDWSGTVRVVPNDVLLEAGQIGTFSLRDKIGEMLQFPEDGLGFLILGHNEEMHFNDAACVSKIEDVTLNVTTLAR